MGSYCIENSDCKAEFIGAAGMCEGRFPKRTCRSTGKSDKCECSGVRLAGEYSLDYRLAAANASRLL